MLNSENLAEQSYAIKNDKDEYSRIWNADFKTGFVAGYFTTSTPIQHYPKDYAEKVLFIFQSNGHKVELVEVKK